MHVGAQQGKVQGSHSQTPSSRITSLLCQDPTIQDIFQIRIFEEPLVTIGDHPSSIENTALVSALLNYSKRSNAEDFSSLTGFIKKYPKSPWNAGLLTNLGLQ